MKLKNKRMKTKTLKSALQITVVAFALVAFFQTSKVLGKELRKTWRSEAHTLTTRSFVNLLNK